MRHFGLIGRRLGHSFSAKFFNSKFKAEEIAADYQLFELEDVSAIDDLICKHGLEGFNITIPYKESIIPYLDELSDDAREIGAVNCVVVKDGRKVGYNTDIVGIEASLQWLDLVHVCKVKLKLVLHEVPHSIFCLSTNECVQILCSAIFQHSPKILNHTISMEICYLLCRGAWRLYSRLV